jgi:ABC-type branched-subunit amino acid transport system permease subunit
MPLALVWLIPLAIGLPLGFTRITSGRLPLISAGLLVFLYVAFFAIAYFATGTASCPHCTAGHDDSRRFVFESWLLIVGFLVLLQLVGIVAGAFIAGPFVRWRRNRSQAPQS